MQVERVAESFHPEKSVAAIGEVVAVAPVCLAGKGRGKVVYAVYEAVMAASACSARGVYVIVRSGVSDHNLCGRVGKRGCHKPEPVVGVYTSVGGDVYDAVACRGLYA